MNGVAVTRARHDEVIRLLTSDSCQEFTIVVYRDPSHPLSPTSSPRSHLFMPSQHPLHMTVDSSVVAKRPSPGPELHVSTTAAGSAAVSFVPRPTSAKVGKFPTAADVGKSLRTVDAVKSPPYAVKTVTYSIGDSGSASVEPPMPVMRLHEEMTSMSPRAPSSAGLEPVVKVSQGVPCRDGNLLFVSPPAPPRSSTGSGVSDLFDALQKTYRASQQGASDHDRASYDAGTRSSTTAGQGSSLMSADRKRHSLDVRLHFDYQHQY